MGRRGKVARFQLKSTPTQKTKLLAMADDAKLEEIQKLGGTAIKPVGWDRTGWEAFQYMLYNPDTGEVLTRTPLSWLKITVFYCIYYCDKEKGEDSEGRCLPDIEKHLAKQGADKNNFVYINCRGRYAADQEALA